MILVKTSDLIDIFNQGTRGLTNPNSGSDWVSIDGKCLKSTCKNPGNNSHKFLLIVFLFSQTTGLVLRLQSFENTKKFRNQTGTLAGIDGEHSRASIYLGRFALSKTNNYSNN